jgi:hypothetical protein
VKLLITARDLNIQNNIKTARSYLINGLLGMLATCPTLSRGMPPLLACAASASECNAVYRHLRFQTVKFTNFTVYNKKRTPFIVTFHGKR